MPKKTKLGTIGYTLLALVVFIVMLLVQAFFTAPRNSAETVAFLRQNFESVVEAIPEYNLEQLQMMNDEEVYHLLHTHLSALTQQLPELYSQVLDYRGLAIFTILEVVAYAFWWRHERKKVHDLNPYPLNRHAWLLIMGVAVGISLSAIAAHSIVEHWGYEGTREDLQIIRNGSLMLYMFVVVVGAPFAEEFFYRGILFTRLRSWMSLRTAMLVQAIFFGLLHGEIINMVMAAFLAYFFAELFLRTGSLRAPIIAHVMANSLPTLLLFPILLVVVFVQFLVSGQSDPELFFETLNIDFSFLLLLTLPMVIYCWRKLYRVLPPLPALRTITTPYAAFRSENSLILEQDLDFVL